MRRFFGVVAVLMLSTVAGAQEYEFVLTESQQEQYSFLRRLMTLQKRTPLQTFHHEGQTYFMEHIRNGYNGYVQLVNLMGAEAPDAVKMAFVTRCLHLDPNRYYYGGNEEGCEMLPAHVEGASAVLPYPAPIRGDDDFVIYPLSDEGFVLHPTLHWVPLGVARSYREPAGIGKQNYIPFALGATGFAFRVDGGRLYVHGITVAFALGGSDPDSQWSGTLQVSWVPVAVHVWKGLYVAPTLGTAEITGRSLLRWKGIKTVGLQFSLCVSACTD